jgi:signal transduction histidine kinase
LKRRPALVATFGAAVLAALIFVGVLVFNATIDRIVIDQAERTSAAWASYIGNRMNRIEAIAEGAPLSDEEQQFLTGIRGISHIFRFKLFDTKGRIRLISDDLNTDLANNPTVGEDNWKALKVIKTGNPVSELEDGRLKPDRPDIYVETYVPVWRNARMVAVAEVYMDRTEDTAALRADFLRFGLHAAGLVILALSLPAGVAAWTALQLRRQNHVLNIERNRAREAERAKGRFLAHMSHEFRTPLNSIQGLTQVLLRGDLGALDNPKHREYVHDIYESGSHLLSLVNDVLDLSKIDFGKYELTESDFDIGKCVHAALQVVKGWEASNPLTLEVRGLETGLFVHADRRALYQSVLNLLSNAVKFTPPGGRIDLSVSINDAGECIVTVADTGVGIAERDQPQIFEPFSQRGNHEYVASRRGTGLGLALVKSLIELHGGRVALESAPGIGTTVSMHLPKSRVVNPPA